MDFQRGERVVLNFDTGGIEKADADPTPDHDMASPPSFVADILERQTSIATNPPVAPSLKAKSNVNGFPAHRKRVVGVPSAFRMQQQQQRRVAEREAGDAMTTTTTTTTTAAAGAAPNKTEKQQGQRDRLLRQGFSLREEKKAIDEENKRKIAAMSDGEIERERKDLLESLSPEVVRRLLMRSRLEEGSNERDFGGEEQEEDGERREREGNEEMGMKRAKKVQFLEQDHPEKGEEEEDEPRTRLEEPLTSTSTSTSTSIPSTTPASTQQIPSALPPPPNNPNTSTPTSESIHFPTPPQPPDLDPTSPTFLQSLHKKYFPNLAYNPSSLSWMTPIDPCDKTSAYHPSQTALNPSDLRFDFKGALLPPSVARQIPTDQGLHHHAAAPEAAGYTIPELALTARSQVPAQRCVAYQTLGRILYRLGSGEFGIEKAARGGQQGAMGDGAVNVVRDPDASEDEDEDEDEESGEEGADEEQDVGSVMAQGLWACVEEGRVIETLTEEANRSRGHLTARTFAQEALWNWRRGGGRKRLAV